MNTKTSTSNGELLSTFRGGNSSNPIQGYYESILPDVIGRVFLLNGGHTEQVEDTANNSITNRAVYEVRVISKNARLPLGTNLTIKIKGAESILTDEDNANILLGTQTLVVAFDNINHWLVNGNREGLSASEMRVLDINPSEAMEL